ncbi:MAG: DUF1998 domain-containing protein, partial [Polyangiaceae bacterium]|nr:DUF1998 domain-containing protein [Polyangiaceae bacterium]
DVASEAASVSPGRELTYGFDPTLFLFDNVPGGIGLAARIHEQAPELLARVRHLLTKCGCDAGCPLCVGAVDAPLPQVPGRAPVETRKRSSLILLERLLHDA